MKSKQTSNQNTSTERSLSLEEGRILVNLARLAIENYLEKNEIIKPPTNLSPLLREKSGVFVTLNTVTPTRELRGCIGFPYPEEQLVQGTIKAAIYAATEDPRFSPVSIDELKSLVAIEVTALTPPRPLETRDRRRLPELIEVGRHGLIIDGRGHSGLLLPQVATEWKWDASEFLTNCCMKAGVPPDSWLVDGYTVKVFEGEIFEETAPGGEVRRKSIGEA